MNNNGDVKYIHNQWLRWMFRNWLSLIYLTQVLLLVKGLFSYTEKKIVFGQLNKYRAEGAAPLVTGGGPWTHGPALTFFQIQIFFNYNFYLSILLIFP